MGREKVFYREQIALIHECFPGKVALTVTEVAQVLGIDRRAVEHLILTRKLAATDISNGKTNRRYIVPVAAVAKFTGG